MTDTKDKTKLQKLIDKTNELIANSEEIAKSLNVDNSAVFKALHRRANYLAGGMQILELATDEYSGDSKETEIHILNAIKNFSTALPPSYSTALTRTADTGIAGIEFFGQGKYDADMLNALLTGISAFSPTTKDIREREYGKSPMLDKWHDLASDFMETSNIFPKIGGDYRQRLDNILQQSLPSASQILTSTLTNQTRDSLSLVNDSASKRFFEIIINPHPQPQNTITNEETLHLDVTDGYITNSPTHQVKSSNNLLENTDFASTQMASMATGGIRPGEVQLDPNINPPRYLSQFYTLQPENDNPDFSLRNALILNSLATATTINTFVDPILLDLDGLGIGTTGLTDSVLFDIDNTGSLKRSGWTDTRTGLLVIDDGSGQVISIRQLFSEYYGAMHASGEKRFSHGFAALASEDSNADGLINADDAIWSRLRVWVDGSHNARVDDGELKTLLELGITQFDLNIELLNDTDTNGNQRLAKGTFVINSFTRDALAISFLGDTVSSRVSSLASGTRIDSTSGATVTSAYSGNTPHGETLNATTLQVKNLYGGSGDDHLTASPEGSWLVGGGGSNTYIGDIGDDVFVISSTDDTGNIQGKGGRDTVLIVGNQDVVLDMSATGVTIAQGGAGNDLIVSGGNNDVFIRGGTGNSTLIGGAGNDVIAGGLGRNTIIGGSGKSVIHAGPQGDVFMRPLMAASFMPAAVRTISPAAKATM